MPDKPAGTPACNGLRSLMNETSAATRPLQSRWRRRLKWAIYLLGFLLAAPLFAYFMFRWAARGDDPFDVAAFTSYSLPDERNAFTYFRKAQRAYVIETDNSVQIATTKEPPSNSEDFRKSVEATEEGDWSQAIPEVRRWV